MNFNLLLKNIISVMIITPMLFTHSYAGSSNTEVVEINAPVSVQVSFGLPNQGYLDSFHNSQNFNTDSHQEQMEYSLYALRNIAVMKLLKARMALKEIIGDEQELRRLSKHYKRDNLEFSPPDSVKKLYLGENKIIDIADSVDWLEGIDRTNNRSFSNPVNFELRKNLYTGLIAVSAQVVKYDNLIKYVQKDLWVKAFPDKVARKFLKKKYIKNYNLKDLEIQLIGQRDALLYRYHMLNFEHKKVPLYKRIYSNLEKDFFFPNAEIVQKVQGQIFVEGKDSISLPESMEKEIADKTQEILGNDFALEDAIKSISAVVDEELLTALENNGKALADLTEPIHYSDDEELFEFLAIDESLWDEVQKNYYYLKDKINFPQGLSKAYGNNLRRGLSRETLKTVGMQMGITLAVASAIFTGGSSLAAGGAIAGGVSAGTAATLTTAATVTGAMSTVIMVGQSSFNYYEAKKYAEWSRNLFTGSRDLSSVQDMKNYAFIEKSEFSSLIFSLILAGAPTLVTRGFSAARTLIIKGGREFVKLEIQELKQIHQVYLKYVERVRALGALGQSLIRKNISTFIQVTGQTERVLRLESIIAQTAQKLGMTYAKAKNILMSLPQSRSVLEWYAGKSAANPLFMSQLLREVGLDLLMHISSEAMVRGDMFWEEIDYVIINALVGVVVVSNLMIKSTASATRPKMMFNVLLDQRNGLFSKGLSAAARMSVLKEGGMLFLKPGLELAATSAGASFVISGISETLTHYREPGKEEFEARFNRVLQTSLYYGLFIGIVSNINSQASNGWLEPKVAAKIGRRELAKKGILDPSLQEILDVAKTSKLHQGVMSSISLTNGFVENSMFTLGIRGLGIQNSEEEPNHSSNEEGPLYFRLVQNNDHAKYLYDFL